MNRLTLLAAALLCVAGMAQNSRNKAPEATGFAPIAFFNKKCTDCHPKNGADYKADIVNRYTEKTLTDRLVQMTDTMARAPLSNKELTVLQAWIKAAAKREPFVVWTETDGRTVTVETSPDAKLTSNIGTVTKGKENWTVAVPAGKKVSDLVLTVSVEKKTTVLKLAEASSSHTTPLKK